MKKMKKYFSVASFMFIKTSEQLHLISPLLANVPISYPLTTPENQTFSGIFRGHKVGILTINGLRSETSSFSGFFYNNAVDTGRNEPQISNTTQNFVDFLLLKK